jgi:hypothetical protein
MTGVEVVHWLSRIQAVQKTKRDPKRRAKLEGTSDLKGIG